MDRDTLRSLFDLTGRVAIVTGGTRGIGRAIAEGFVAAGAKVAVASRKADACEETERALVAAGGEAIGVPTHMGELDALHALVDRTVDAFGRVDIVVNNAAITFPGDVDLPMKRYDLIFAVNTRAPLIAVQTALPGMRARGEGAILNVSSLAALNYFPTQMAYGMSKIALEHMTVSLATQLLDDRIPVNTFRIDVPVASEGFVYNSPGVDISDWEPTDVAAEGILWMLRQPPEYTGNNVGMAALREEQGIMTTQSARRHAHLDRINRVNPMPVNRMQFPMLADE
jgi:NAD(P)-dependent dehydrogenase (short-subunit alcohol dehydrogenase family)